MKTQIITINSRKFNNSIHRSWNCKLLSESDEYWLFVGEFESEIRHAKLGVIRRGTISYEYYWKEKWFNVFRLHEPERDFKFFYCNINMPPKLTNNVLDYIDLDIDILVQKDFYYEILDLEEFEEHKKIFGYSEEMEIQIQKSLEELLEMIRLKDFPFNLTDVK